MSYNDYWGHACRNFVNDLFGEELINKLNFLEEA